MPLGRQGPLAKALTSGIGLTQEYRADRKARSEAEGQSVAPVDEVDTAASAQIETSSDLDDEDAWAQDLDDVESDYSGGQAQAGDNSGETIEDVVRQFTSAHATLGQVGTESLKQPVVLPQRRPGMRTRGWIRAYGPALAGRDVSQTAWLDFLAGFEKAIGKNRWFHVLNFAVWVADKVRLALQGVSLIARVVSATIHLTLEMSRRGYIHKKQNSYLDELNEQYFKPRGLYALVIKYKPKKQSSAADDANDSGPAPIETMDINTNVGDIIEQRKADEGKFWKGLLKAAASKTTSEEAVPEFSPLIFPYLDALDEAQRQSALKRNGAFLADYYDRRASATFAVDRPDSKLADVAPMKPFVSEYADPANPKSHGTLISTLSGGKIESPSSRARDRLKEARTRLGIGGSQTVLERRQETKAGRKSMRPMKMLLRQDALYLMVAELPNQEVQEMVRVAIEDLADDA